MIKNIKQQSCCFGWADAMGVRMGCSFPYTNRILLRHLCTYIREAIAC